MLFYNTVYGYACLIKISITYNITIFQNSLKKKN